MLYWPGKQIPNFGVSTAILNTIDILLRWCKWNFDPLQGQVKAHNFHERKNEETMFQHSIKKSWNNWQETTWTIL